MNYSFRSFQSQSDLSFRKLAKSCNIQDPFIFNSPLENIISIAFISQKSQDTRSFNPSSVQDYSSTRASETIEMEDSFFDQRQVRTLTIDRWWSHERRQDDFIPHN